MDDDEWPELGSSATKSGGKKSEKNGGAKINGRNDAKKGGNNCDISYVGDKKETNRRQTRKTKSKENDNRNGQQNHVRQHDRQSQSSQQGGGGRRRPSGAQPREFGRDHQNSLEGEKTRNYNNRGQKQLYHCGAQGEDSTRRKYDSNQNFGRASFHSRQQQKLKSEAYRRMKAEQAREDEKVRANITNHVVALQQQNTVQDEIFTVIHFNILTKTEEVPCQYFPCELGMAKFSLQQGVTDELHSYMLAVDVPVGYSFQIKYDTERTHQLDAHSTPLTRLRQQCGDDPVYHYETLLRQMFDFVTQSKNQYYTIYTVSEEIEKVNYILQVMCDQTDRSENPFRVYPLDHLLFRLSTNTPRGDMLTDSILALARLEQELYLYTCNLACAFHESQDQIKHCSLMLAKRWAYITCAECAPHYDIEIVCGRHVPVEIDSSYHEKYTAAGYEGYEPSDGVVSADTEWVPMSVSVEVSRRSRYVDNLMTNDWGVAKSKSAPAGVIINDNPSWVPTFGSSKHAFLTDRKLLEHRQNLGGRCSEDTEPTATPPVPAPTPVQHQGGGVNPDESEYAVNRPNYMTSPFARGRGFAQSLNQPLLSEMVGSVAYNQPPPDTFAGVSTSVGVAGLGRGRVLGPLLGRGRGIHGVDGAGDMASGLGRGFADLRL